MRDLFAVVGLMAVLSTACVVGGIVMAALRCKAERPTPRLDHECDVLAGAEDKGERLVALYHADMEIIDTVLRDLTRRAA